MPKPQLLVGSIAIDAVAENGDLTGPRSVAMTLTLFDPEATPDTIGLRIDYQDAGMPNDRIDRLPWEVLHRLRNRIEALLEQRPGSFR